MNKMRFAVLCLTFAIITLAFVGCGNGSSSVDVGQHAIVELPNGEIVEGEVKSLTRWSASLTEITIDDNTYMVHPLKVAIVIVEEDEQ